MTVYQITSRANKLAGIFANPYLLRNAGSATIYLGTDSSLAVGNQSLSMVAGSTLNWAGGSELWAITAAGQTGTLEVMQDAGSAFTPGPSEVEATISQTVNVEGIVTTQAANGGVPLYGGTVNCLGTVGGHSVAMFPTIDVSAYSSVAVYLTYSSGGSTGVLSLTGSSNTWAGQFTYGSGSGFIKTYDYCGYGIPISCSMAMPNAGETLFGTFYYFNPVAISDYVLGVRVIGYWDDLPPSAHFESTLLPTSSLQIPGSLSPVTSIVEYPFSADTRAKRVNAIATGATGWFGRQALYIPNRNAGFSGASTQLKILVSPGTAAAPITNYQVSTEIDVGLYQVALRTENQTATPGTLTFESLGTPLLVTNT